MWLQLVRTGRTYLYVATINVLISLTLFSLAEFSYRIHRDGFREGLINLGNLLRDAPYSNLGTGNWVIYDKELGYRLNPERPGINSRSIRHDEIIVPKPSGLYRIVVLGDSIPWERPGFVKYVEETLNKERKVEMINASVPGYTSYQEVLFFKRYLQETEPDLVLWTYCLNDNHKFLHRFDEKARMLWTAEAVESLKSNSLFEKLVNRSYILSELKLRLVSRQKQLQVCRYPWECVPDFNIAWKDEPWVQYETYLDEVKRLTQKMQSRLAIVVFPYEPQIEQLDRGKDTEYILKPQRQIAVLCKKYDVPCLDLFPAFFQKRGSAFKLFRDGIHLSKEGHQLAGELLVAFLRENSLVSQDKP